MALSIRPQYRNFSLGSGAVEACPGNFLLSLRLGEFPSGIATAVPDLGQEIGVSVAMENQLGTFRQAVLHVVHHSKRLVFGILRIEHAKDTGRLRANDVTSGPHLGVLHNKW